MRNVKVILTYEFDYDDELTLDAIHERWEDYIDLELPLCIFIDENDISINLKLTRILTSSGKDQLITFIKNS